MNDHRRPPLKDPPAPQSGQGGVINIEDRRLDATGKSLVIPYMAGDPIPMIEDAVYIIQSGSVAIQYPAQGPNGPHALTLLELNKGDSFNEGILAEGYIIGGQKLDCREQERRMRYVALTNVTVMKFERGIELKDAEMMKVYRRLLMVQIKKSLGLSHQVVYYHEQTQRAHQDRVHVALEAASEGEKLEDKLNAAHREIARLEKELAASKARERDARGKLDDAFKHIESDRVVREAQAAEVWRQLELLHKQAATSKLSPGVMATLLGLDPFGADDDDAAHLAAAINAGLEAFDEVTPAIMPEPPPVPRVVARPLSPLRKPPPPQPVPKPKPKRSRTPSIGADDRREPSQQAPRMSIEEPLSAQRAGITMPGSQRNPEAYDEAPDDDDDTGHSPTSNWGLASDLGTADPPKK